MRLSPTTRPDPVTAVSLLLGPFFYARPCYTEPIVKPVGSGRVFILSDIENKNKIEGFQCKTIS